MSIYGITMTEDVNVDVAVLSPEIIVGVEVSADVAAVIDDVAAVSVGVAAVSDDVAAVSDDVAAVSDDVA
jgi:hypothetical protein